jgi:hypothetical protein
MLRLLPRGGGAPLAAARRWVGPTQRTFGTAAAAATAPSRHRAIALARAAAAPLQAARSAGSALATPRQAWVERSLEDDECTAITR